MYGDLKIREQRNGLKVGKYSGIVQPQNLEFLKGLVKPGSRTTETALCNILLNNHLDELRRINASLLSSTVTSPKDSSDANQD